MLTEDLRTLIDRLERIDRAVDLACVSLERHYSPQIADALTDTCTEAVSLGHELTMRVFYDEPWSRLDTLHQIWVFVHTMIRRVAGHGVDTMDTMLVSDATRDGLATLCIATAALETAGLQVATTPRDATALRAASQAITDLAAAADHVFMTAVTAMAGPEARGVSRLDAAYAILTATAARAARERASVNAHQ
ncbi:hypothetical protein [Euzebya tangerina]|uniref:hypothetical protein n=1 Tax=Euzebya tangerina TaxID=591198 RepID=UPI000E31B463|nr:hypothetical protein [Euzebya tangerina]